MGLEKASFVVSPGPGADAPGYELPLLRSLRNSRAAQAKTWRSMKENRSSGQGRVPSFALRSRDQKRECLDQSLLDAASSSHISDRRYGWVARS